MNRAPADLTGVAPVGLTGVAAVLAVACGGKTSSDADARLRFEEDLAEVTAWADRTCACRDKGCAMKVDYDVEKAIRAWEARGRRDEGVDFGRDDERGSLGAEMNRMATCILARGGAPEAIGAFVTATFALLRDRACGCGDYACLVAVADEWNRKLPQLAHVPANRRTIDQITSTDAAAQACFARAPELRTREAVREAAGLRRRGCTCVDTACADGVQRDFDTFLERYADVYGTPDAADQIGAQADALARCLDDARARPPAARGVGVPGRR
jgi:hypothetical protein